MLTHVPFDRPFTNREARAIMQNAQKEEFKHFGMEFEFVLRQKKVFRETLKGIHFQPGDIVEHRERGGGLR